MGHENNDRADKRKSPRIVSEVSVSFTVADAFPHDFFPGITQDISSGGIFLATDQLMPIGTRLRLLFAVDDRDISGHAEVRWVRSGDDPGMGLLFLDLTPEDRDAVDLHIRQKK